MGSYTTVDQKRCEWCGSLSPADAEKCVLCRIAFGVPVPPPRDWSELTGNIPVITAPLLDEPRQDPAQAPASAPVTTPGAASTRVEAPAVTPAAAAPVDRPANLPAAPPTAPPVAAPLRVPAARPSPDVTPSLAVAAVEAPAAAPDAASTSIPGWRPPDDPTLKVFAESLEARERRRSSRGSVARRRRRIGRLLVWVIGLALITGSVVLAQARLPFL